MTIYELIKCYTRNMTSNVTVEMESPDDKNIIIYDWDAEDHRNDFDGSYSNVLWHIPEDIGNAAVKYFEVIPKHLVFNKEIITLGNTDTLYIIIPTYSKLFKYCE